MMKVLVCGGRTYSDRDRVFRVLTDIYDKYGAFIVVHGGAKGADTLAAQWADYVEFTSIRCPAPWKRMGKRAGIARNEMMLKTWEPDYIVAFPGGSGTDDMVRRAEQSGTPVMVVTQ